MSFVPGASENSTTVPVFAVFSLTVQHLAGSDPPQFQVIWEPSGKKLSPVVVPPADSFSVASSLRSDLLCELQWYLERFLDYPFPPETDRAERVLKALRHWGETAFDALFAGRSIHFIERAGYDQLQLEIRSDDPRLLSWPWEALRDPRIGSLGRIAQVERRIATELPVPATPPELPSDRINILFVSARPGKGPGEDVAYRTNSRPLVELITELKLAARVHVLRPPTLARLADHLQERPATYHVLHFDGHGTYARGPRGSEEGGLIFEGEAGQPEHVPGWILAKLLRRSRLPMVVLNACGSAKLDVAVDVFASVATALLRAGISSIVAMAYELYASASEVLMPAFYRSLFETGSAAQAIRAGRQGMFESPGRICVRGRFPLQDWLVPVLYGAGELAVPVAAAQVPKLHPLTAPLGLPAVSASDDFFDRDGEFLDLERALRKEPAAILIRGLWGVGKTTLLRQFVEWLHHTEGLGEGCFWLDLGSVPTAEEIFDAIGCRLIGPAFVDRCPEEKADRLAATLRERRFLIVWDHFEAVTGIPGAWVTPAFSAADRRRLLALLGSLRGGETKILIASTRGENWLSDASQDCGVIVGLRREARWACCERLLGDIGRQIDRDDDDLAMLVDLLAGHPQAMRMVVPALGRYPARRLLEALHSDLGALDLEKDTTLSALKAKVCAVATSLPEDLGPLLVPLSLHRRILAMEHLEIMAQLAAPSLTGAHLRRFISHLVAAGLLQDWGPTLYYLHPVLIGLLLPMVRQRYGRATIERWSEAFVTVMAKLAESFTSAPVGEQREIFEDFQDNFSAALSAADRLPNRAAQIALLHAHASYAYNLRDFATAEKIFEHLAPVQQAEDNPGYEAAACHMLGSLAEDKGDFEVAESWYRRSIALEEELGNDEGIAKTRHMLGNLALEQGALDVAERRYRQALEIWMRLDAETSAAETYHMLGSTALKKKDYVVSEEWYKKALRIEEAAGDDDADAATHLMLANLALEKHEQQTAKSHYLKALHVNKELEAPERTARIYTMLGELAMANEEFETAEQWYYKSLSISERLEHRADTAPVYHRLGVIAKNRRDFETAREWHEKALDVNEEFGDDFGVSENCHQLGAVAQALREYETAQAWYEKAAAIKGKIDDRPGLADVYSNLGMVAQARRHFEAAERWYRRSLENRDRIQDPGGAALTLLHRGTLSNVQGRYLEACLWVFRSIQSFIRADDRAMAERAGRIFLFIYGRASAMDREVFRKLSAGGHLTGLAPRDSDSRVI